MRENTFLKGLRAGEAQIGLWCSLGGTYATEVIAGVGYDWILVDMEHAPNDLLSVTAQLQVFAGFQSTPIVRPDWNDKVKVKRLLDMGAPGLLFPMVQSVEEAEAAVAACRYPPRGVRGFAGLTRASSFGRDKDYFTRAEDETAILVQAESLSAVEACVELGQVDGVDGVFFGPADIAADMGLLGQATHPEVWALIRSAAKRLQAAGIPAGTLVSDAGFARELLDDGFLFVACGLDVGLLSRGATELLATVKGR